MTLEYFCTNRKRNSDSN